MMGNKKSWRTTLSGWLILLGAIATVAGQVMADPGFGVDEAMQILGMTGIGTGGVGVGLFSRDDKVTSEGKQAPKDY